MADVYEPWIFSPILSTSDSLKQFVVEAAFLAAFFYLGRNQILLISSNKLTKLEYILIMIKVALGKQIRQEEKQMDEVKKMRLFDGKNGNLIRITSINIEGVMRRRLLDLGFVPGTVVEIIRRSPLGDPIAFRVSQTTIALRKEESMKIEGELIRHE